MPLVRIYNPIFFNFHIPLLERLRKIANSVRLEGKETEAQLLKANQDTILLRQRTMQDSMKALADQMFELRAMIGTIPGIVKKKREEDVAGFD